MPKRSVLYAAQEMALKGLGGQISEFYVGGGGGCRQPRPLAAKGLNSISLSCPVCSYKLYKCSLYFLCFFWQSHSGDSYSLYTTFCLFSQYNIRATVSIAAWGIATDIVAPHCSNAMRKLKVQLPKNSIAVK
jgi:hypothetical protein